jgi:hypothetical protein
MYHFREVRMPIFGIENGELFVFSPFSFLILLYYLTTFTVSFVFPANLSI